MYCLDIYLLIRWCNHLIRTFQNVRFCSVVKPHDAQVNQLISQLNVLSSQIITSYCQLNSLSRKIYHLIRKLLMVFDEVVKILRWACVCHSVLQKSIIIILFYIKGNRRPTHTVFGKAMSQVNERAPLIPVLLVSHLYQSVYGVGSCTFVPLTPYQYTPRDVTYLLRVYSAVTSCLL